MHNSPEHRQASDEIMTRRRALEKLAVPGCILTFAGAIQLTLNTSNNNKLHVKREFTEPERQQFRSTIEGLEETFRANFAKETSSVNENLLHNFYGLQNKVAVFLKEIEPFKASVFHRRAESLQRATDRQIRRLNTPQEHSREHLTEPMRRAFDVPEEDNHLF